MAIFGDGSDRNNEEALKQRLVTNYEDQGHLGPENSREAVELLKGHESRWKDERKLKQKSESANSLI